MVVRITDISSRDQLLHYAASAQLEWVKRTTRYSREQIAVTLPRWHNAGNFSRVLKKPTTELLQALDEKLMALDPDLSATGGLAALSVRLGRGGSLAVLTARQPAAWRAEMLSTMDAATELDLLGKASALLAELWAVPGYTHVVASRRRPVLSELVKRLILIGAAPPTHRNVDALILLGSIAGTETAFDEVERELEVALHTNPLGFRVWRAVTSVVRTYKATTDLPQTSPDAVQPWVREQVKAAENLRKSSIFPARSLDLELCIATPIEWSLPSEGDDWIDQAVRSRIENDKATVRERATAAHGLWRRALRHDDPDYQHRTELFLRDMIGSFREEAKGGDVLLGLYWAAETLESNINNRFKTTTYWPDRKHHYVALVEAATAELSDVPTSIREATRFLIEHSLLQNSGVIRRHAIDVLAAGGWGGKLLPVYAKILNDLEVESWLKCRTLFALSFLQDRRRVVAQQLERSCRSAYRKIFSEGSPESASRGAISEMHAALFAVGDCFGTTNAEAQGSRLRASLDEIIRKVVDLSDTDADKAHLYPIGRAATYVLGTTASDGDQVTCDYLGEKSKNHKDPVVQNLSKWAHSRFEPRTYKVRPFHEMSKYFP